MTGQFGVLSSVAFAFRNGCSLSLLTRRLYGVDVYQKRFAYVEFIFIFLNHVTYCVRDSVPFEDNVDPSVR